MSEPGGRLARELAEARERDPAAFDAARPVIEARVNRLLPSDKADFERELKRLLTQRQQQQAAGKSTFSQQWQNAAARDLQKRGR